jgi:Retrotransposon gag protein
MLPQNLPLNLPQNPPQDVPLQDVPPIPNIPPVPVQPPPPDPMIQLTEAIVNLTAISTMHLANNVSGAKIVMCPTPFAGERGADARRFLATFTMWAMVQGSGLNIVDAQGNPTTCQDHEWIRAVLSLLTDEAAVWAAPTMEEFVIQQIPFAGVWENFRIQFRAHFKTSDEAGDAKETLHFLFQNDSTVPEYAAQFRQVMGRTGYSAADLRDRFYDHLSPHVKDVLVIVDRLTRTLDELVATASDLNLRIRQRRVEKERKRRRKVANTGITTQNLHPEIPAPKTDLVGMDVDAMRTKEEYMRRMRGRCFGCGSTSHTRKDGHHERDLCKYCMRVCHLELACIDKYMGRPKSQKTAAMLGEGDPFEEDFLEGEPEEEAKGAQVAATYPNALTQLLEQQKALADQITAWREEGF